MDQDCVTIEALLPDQMISMVEVQKWFQTFPLPVSSYVFVPEEPYTIQLRLLYLKPQDNIIIPADAEEVLVIEYPAGDFVMFILPQGVSFKGKFVMVEYGNQKKLCTTYEHQACTVLLEVPSALGRMVEYISVKMEGI